MARLQVKKNIKDRMLGHLIDKGAIVEGTLEPNSGLDKNFKPVDTYFVTVPGKGFKTQLSLSEVIVLEK